MMMVEYCCSNAAVVSFVNANGQRGCCVCLFREDTAYYNDSTTDVKGKSGIGASLRLAAS
jgi:hypothetical protein